MFNICDLAALAVVLFTFGNMFHTWVTHRVCRHCGHPVSDDQE